MKRTIDLAASTVLLIIPIILMAITFSDQFDVPTFGGDVGPTLAPRAYFVVWIILAASACAMAYKTQALSETSDEDGFSAKQLFGTAIVIFATAVAMMNIGFVFSAIPGFFLFCLAFGYRKPVPLILTSVIAPLVVWALFTFGFELILPRSPWFNIL